MFGERIIIFLNIILAFFIACLVECERSSFDLPKDQEEELVSSKVLHFKLR